MKRRDFFKRIGGAAVGAVVAAVAAPKRRERPEVAEGSPYHHVEYGHSFDVPREYARLLAESARRREEQMALSVFNNSFSG